MATQLRSGVTQIFTNEFAFAALKADGSVVTWGGIFDDENFGGDSSAVASQLRSDVVGFANPFTDDWLVGDPTPSISLALAPALVSEDGGANLIYTFSRTGDASNALTVSYGIAGTADGSDYSGASPGPVQSITFSLGQSTATLSLDPTADTTSEADETVALTLVPGSGYTVGTTTAVIGTISNDDFPSTLPENTSTASPIQLSASLISGDTPASTTISLSGPDAAAFVVEGAALFLKAGVALDYETKANYAVTVSVSDGNRPDAPPVTTAYNLSVSDVNEAPTALAFNNITSTLPDTRSTANRVRVADIAITDDALGTNTVTLSGADAASFEVEGTALFLKAGTRLSHETKPSYSVNVSAADPSLPGSTGPSAAFTLAIGNSIPVTIFNADLSPGTDLSILSTLDLDDAGLASLAALGIQHNATGIDFQLTCHPDQDKAQVSAALDLVAKDLLPQLSDASGRRPARKLLFYGLYATGAITPLTYDPITGAGARFYDLNNDGRADLLTLGLIDGGPGDKDGERNGLIADPSFAAFVDLNHPRFITNGSNTVTVSDPTNAAPAALQLQATLTGRPNSSNEIGYVVLDPSEVARSESLLNNPAWLRQRAQTLFSSLENTDVTLPSGTIFNRDFGLINGQSLRFFEIQDASLQQLLSLNDPRFRWLTPTTVSEPNLSDPQVEFNSSSGVRFALRFLPSDPGLDSLISQSQGLAPVLDLSAFNASQNLSGTVALGREAAFNSSVGFYRTLDATGTVIAGDGITRLRPGENGYAAAALLPANRVAPLSGLSVANGQTTSRAFNGVSGATFLAPFAEVNGHTFFAFGAANPDGISHFRTLGNNLVGLEDLLGGGDQDYDDLVIGFTFSGIA